MIPCREVGRLFEIEFEMNLLDKLYNRQVTSEKKSSSFACDINCSPVDIICSDCDHICDAVFQIFNEVRKWMAVDTPFKSIY